MNLKISGVGAEPKKIAILVGLGAIAGYFYFSNSNSGGSSTPAPVPAANSVQQPAAAPRIAARSAGRAGARVTQKGLNTSSREFKPSFTHDIDPSNVDPTLHLNLLA